MKKAVFCALLLAWLLFQAQVQAKIQTSPLLHEVEGRYRAAKTVRMDVVKTLKIDLLKKEKKSIGVIQVKTGGRLRWETGSPQHSLILIEPRAVWLVEYPEDKDEKISILKAAKPERSQPHALVTFLMGSGRLSDDFEVVSERDAEDDLTRIELEPRKDKDNVHQLVLFVDKKQKVISRISFLDSVNNVTELIFTKIAFDVPIPDRVFRFKPPTGADITVVD